MMGSIATILILALLAVIVFYCIRSLAKGGSSCGGNCSSCGGSCNHCGSGKGQGATDAEEVRRQVEILKSEAVAVACGGGTCCVPFEQAECFRISFVKDGQILGSMISSSGLRGTKEKIALLKNCTVNRVICRGIGAGALSQLEAAGIPCDVVREEGCDAAVRGTAA